MSQFSEFTPDNDPHGEHDFGSFTLVGREFFWKIDYHDRDMIHGSGRSDGPREDYTLGFFGHEAMNGNGRAPCGSRSCDPMTGRRSGTASQPYDFHRITRLAPAQALRAHARGVT